MPPGPADQSPARPYDAARHDSAPHGPAPGQTSARHANSGNFPDARQQRHRAGVLDASPAGVIAAARGGEVAGDCGGGAAGTIDVVLAGAGRRRPLFSACGPAVAGLA